MGLVPDKAGCGAAVVLGLVSTCWWAWPEHRGPGACTYPLVYEAGLRASVSPLMGGAEA